MVMEVGVDLARLDYWMFHALNIIKNVVVVYGGENAIITPAYCDNNGSQSDIYNVLLIDVGRKNNTALVWLKVKELLGEKHDVKIKSGLIQVKYISG